MIIGLFLTLIITVGIVLAVVFYISSQVNSRINSVTTQLNDRLREVSGVLQDTHKGMGERLDNAANMMGNLQNSLGKLEETNRHIFEISKDITSLQNLLRAPKFRGEIGETMLANILDQVLPRDHYKLQYQFKSGEAVDAVILLGENIVPIDAKFPMESFQGFMNATDENSKVAFKKKFTTDVKNRINEIANKYILPQEGTFDFALMYIPAENVYYETTIKQELLSYALNKKVVPVSPNTFYAYLQVICLGLRGLEIEQHSKEILAAISHTQQDILKFGDDFRLVGVHIQNARAKYDEAEKKLDKFQTRFKLLSSSDKNTITGAAGQNEKTFQLS